MVTGGNLLFNLISQEHIRGEAGDAVMTLSVLTRGPNMLRFLILLHNKSHPMLQQVNAIKQKTDIYKKNQSSLKGPSTCVVVTVSAELLPRPVF